MSKKPKEKISDKGMFWGIAITGWVFFFICFLFSMAEWWRMVGAKAIIFSVISLAIAGIFTYLAAKAKEDMVTTIPEKEE